MLPKSVIACLAAAAFVAATALMPTGAYATGGLTAMAETRKLAAFLRRMWSDSASLPGPTRSGRWRG